MASPSPNLTRRLYHGDPLPLGSTLAGYGLALATMMTVALVIGTGRLENALAQLAGLGALPLLLARVHQVPLAAIGLTRPRVGALLGAVIAGAGLWLIALHLAAPIVTATDRQPEIQAWSQTVFGGRPHWALIGLTVVIVPAVCEELTHRGLLASGLTPRLGAPAAIALSTAVFAALHLEPARIAATAVLGVAAGAIAAWSRSLGPAMLVHATNNAIVAALSLGYAPRLRAAIDGHAHASLAIAVGLAVGGLALVRGTSRAASATVRP